MDANKGVLFLYKLKESERWALLDDDRVMVIHPDRPPKIVHPDGRVEEIATSQKGTGMASKFNVVRKMTVGSAVLVLATSAGAALGETTGAPLVSRPSNAAVSPNLSDLPAAHSPHGEKPKVVPAPKRLPPRKAGPGAPGDD